MQTTVAIARTGNQALASADFIRGQGPGRDWWRMFQSAELNRLEAEALAGNPSLKVAASRIAIARQNALAAHAGQLPQISSDDNISRQLLSKNGLIPPPFGGMTINQGNLGASLSYDLDLWGQHRQEFAAALSEAQAAAADAEEARRILTTGVAEAYFNLDAIATRMRVAQAAIQERQGVLKLASARRREGAGNDIAVAQAQADVAAEQQTLENLRGQADEAKYQLAALTGHGPDFAARIALPAEPATAVAVPVPSNLPIDLLARRPDIVAQRLRVEAAAHQIKVARTQFYPNINLAAMIGLQSWQLGNLLSANSLTWSAGPALHLPIFEGGRLRANLGAKEAQYDVAVNQYNQAVLSAAHEVASQLAAIRAVRRQMQAQQRLQQAADKAYRLSLLRYRNGLSDYTAVLIAQRDVLNAHDAAAQLAGTREQAVVALIKALGGGFQEK